MKTFFLSLAGTLAAMLIFFLVLIGFIAALIGMAAGSAPKTPDSIVLSLDLNTPLPDQSPTAGFAAFAAQSGFIDILTSLKAAERDENVKGLYIRGATMGFGSSRAEELRQAIHSFKESGRFVVAHTQGTYGMSGPSAFTSIAAADEIWIQDGTDLFASGVTFETQFMKGLFDLTNVKSEIYPFFEYKNAPNSYNETAYTDPHREAMTALAESFWSTSLESMSADRDIPVQKIRAALESGPQTAQQTIDLGLIHRTGWPEDAERAALERAGDDAEFVSVGMYVTPTIPVKAPQIAVIGGEGAVVTGGSTLGTPFSSGANFASDVIARAILDAGEDDKIKAIVFRVDSPGGSPTASDQIWHAVKTVRDNGKPVVVSMGTYAASGGYYVSAGASHILANEATLTGSIGIFGGKFALEGAFNKVGVTFDTISVGGEFADAYGADAFTESQEVEVRAWLKRGYDRFLNVVAEGRGMTYDQVHAIARGRVWSGRDAIDQGIVDEIGTFMDAIEKAKELGEIDADKETRLVFFPQRKTGFEALESMFGVSAEAAQAIHTLNTIAGDERTQVLLEELSMIDAVNKGQTVAMGPRIKER